MNRAAYSPVPAPPDRRVTQESEPDDAQDGFDWLGWLKHFVLYLCTVTLICLIGLYFLWQIPFLRDPSRLLAMMDDSHAPRPTTAAAPPATPTPAVQDVPSPPPANTAAAPSPPPVTTTAAPSPPPLPTDTVVATTSPVAPPTEPTAVQPTSLEPQPTAVTDSQAAAPATPPAETTTETVPPTPQAGIEQLLTEAQQQMENRRFTAPASGNALSTYRRILELQPDHPTALEGIQRITTYYQDIAQQSLQQGRLDESLAYINRGLRATPKNDALLNLRRQVQQAQKAARQREREEQQRQAALEEMQRQQLEQMRQEQQRRQQHQQLPWWQQPPTYNQSSGFNQR